MVDGEPTGAPERTEHIIAEGRATVRAIEALEAIDPSDSVGCEADQYLRHR